MFCLHLSVAPSERLWRLSWFWITDPEMETPMGDAIAEYWLLNSGSAGAGAVWDAFKAFSRGQYGTLIKCLQIHRKSEVHRAEQSMQALEQVHL